MNLSLTQISTLPPDQRGVKVSLLKIPWINCVDFEFFLGLLKIPKLWQANKLFQPSSPKMMYIQYVDFVSEKIKTWKFNTVYYLYLCDQTWKRYTKPNLTNLFENILFIFCPKEYLFEFWGWHNLHQYHHACCRRPCRGLATWAGKVWCLCDLEQISL